MGQNLVRQIVDQHANWMCRAQDLDYGVDFEAELAPTEFEEQRPAGKLLKLQVKSSEYLDTANTHISITLDRRFLDYAGQFRVPVLLVVVETSSKRAWWLWLQEWLLDNEVRLAESSHKPKVTVRVPTEQTLESGLDSGWKHLALGQTTASIVIAIRDIVTIAASDRAHVGLLSGALEMLDVLETENRTWAAERVIDTMIGYGSSASFLQTSPFILPLIRTIERIGNFFTADQLVRMIVRSEGYSRAGMFGLAELYDKWPERARALGLPGIFKEHSANEIAWYCYTRERYPEYSSLSLWRKFADRSLPGTRYGSIELRIDDELSSKLWKSWPNRGDSVLLDNLTWVGDEQ